MPKKVAAKPLSRTELLSELNKQLRAVQRMRQEIAAMRLAQVEPEDDEPNEPELESLPEVPTEGLPFRPHFTTARQPGTIHSLKSAPNGNGNSSAFNSLPPIITIHPTPYVRSLFAKQRRGLGGFQSLHSALQNRMGGSRELSLNPQDFARVVNYATNYGEGGFQQSLRWLVALWAAENIVPQTLKAQAQ